MNLSKEKPSSDGTVNRTETLRNVEDISKTLTGHMAAYGTTTTFPTIYPTGPFPPPPTHPAGGSPFPAPSVPPPIITPSPDQLLDKLERIAKSLETIVERFCE